MKRLLLGLLLLLSFQVLALEGEIVPQSSKTLDLEEGSLFDGVLRLWPVPDGWDSSQLEKLGGKNIGEAFNVIRIESIERSSHNTEVVELRGLFALIKAVSPKSKIVIALDGRDVLLEVRRLNLIATAPPAQEFELVEQPSLETFFESTSPIIIGSSGALLLVLLVIAAIRLRKYQLRKRELVAAKKEILEAKSRAELESVGRRIRVHQQLLNIPEDKINNFKKQLDLYQYRPNWTDGQLETVRKSLESLIDDR